MVLVSNPCVQMGMERLLTARSVDGLREEVAAGTERGGAAQV